MIQRSNIVIDKKRSRDFNTFIKKNAKNKEFWAENKRIISKPIDRVALDKAFKDNV